MTLAFVAGRGTNSGKTTGSTVVTIQPTALMVAGECSIINVATDNLSTTTGVTNDHTALSSANGQTWTKLVEYTYSPGGVAADGVTVSVWRCVMTANVNSSTTITCTFSGTLFARCITIRQYSLTAGQTMVPVLIQEAHATSSTPSMAISGLTSAAYVFLSLLGVQTDSSLAYTVDANYTGRQDVGTSGSTDDTNITAHLGNRLLTGTASTFAPTLSANKVWEGIHIAFVEGSPSNSYTQSVSGTLTSSATLATLALKIVTLAGTLTSIGGLVKSALRALAGVLQTRPPVAPTLLTSGTTTGTASSPQSSASISPLADQLVLAWVRTTNSGGSPPTTTMSGCGLTWTEVGHIDGFTHQRLTLFRALGSSPSPGALTFTATGCDQFGWTVVQYANSDKSGSGGSGAIAQFVTASNAFTSVAPALAAFASALNAAAGGFTHGINEASTPGSGFTLGHDVVFNTDGRQSNEFYSGEPASDLVPMTWSTTGNNLAIAVEIVRAAVIPAMSGVVVPIKLGNLYTQAVSATFAVGTGALTKVSARTVNLTGTLSSIGNLVTSLILGGAVAPAVKLFGKAKRIHRSRRW